MENTPFKIIPHSCTKIETDIRDEEVSLKTKDNSSNLLVSRKTAKSHTENLLKEVEDLNATYQKVASTSTEKRIEWYEFDQFFSAKKPVTAQRLIEAEKSERIGAYNKERLEYTLKLQRSGSMQCDTSHSFNSPPNTFKEGHIYHVPEAIKKLILLGVICHADVRIGKENRSSCVRRELESLGAVVRKTFTEKVMVVVFNQGYKSTYLRAKELGVPLVSTSWIEACKAARAQVDTSLYPPHNMKTYEEILPYRAIKSPRFRLPKKLKESNDIEGVRQYIENKEKNTKIHAKNRKIFRVLMNDCI